MVKFSKIFESWFVLILSFNEDALHRIEVVISLKSLASSLALAVFLSGIINNAS